MKILNPALKSYIKLRWSVIDNFLLNPIETQIKTFNSLISSAQYTEIGREYGFGNITKISEFKKEVPVHSYEDMVPYINRMMQGQQNVLWRAPISWFAKSSGTTSEKSKFLPVSNEQLEDCHYKAGKDILALYYRNFPQSKLLAGKALLLGGSHQVNQLNAESYYGDLSAVMLQNMSMLQHLIRTPDLSIALMDEWEEKIDKMAESTINDDVTFLAGVPTWTLVLLNKIREKTGEDDIHKVWPNLELYIHGGVNFKPYEEQFKTYFPSQPISYLETYNASEGFFAAQDLLGTQNGMLLFLNHGIFFEFMPLEEDGKEFPNTLQLDEVELNKNYAIIISTNSGLWRYKIGDTIAFTSLNPFRIKVTGRTKHFINAFGEELIIDNAEHAISEAAKATQVHINDYTAAPIYFSGNKNGAHQWLIECNIKEARQEAFINILDLELQKVNSDYEAKRYKNLALRKPEVLFLEEGTFNRWLKSKNKQGGQHKVPRLSNDRLFIEEILKFAGLESVA